MNLTVTNRELLRNYKALKKKLILKSVAIIEIDADREYIIEMRLKRKKREKTPFEHLLDMIETHPIKVERPDADLFDYL